MGIKIKLIKIKFTNNENKILAGIFETPKKTKIKKDKVIIMAHGFGCNKNYKLFRKISHILLKKGFFVFRFDFSGFGESSKALLSLNQLKNDLVSAINLMKKFGFRQICLIGHSLGGLICILVFPYFQKLINSLILLAPLTKAKIPFGLEKRRIDKLIKKGWIWVKDDKGKKYKITKKYMKERLSINQEKILMKLKCNVLILHGDGDKIIPFKDSELAIKILKKLNTKNKLIKIKEANHNFINKHNQIVNCIIKWLNSFKNN